MRKRLTVLLFAGSLCAAQMHGAVTLLVGEPFGRFGAFNPTGHAALYLSRVCAETPTSLRPCRAGETGVVISRYHKVGGYDWLAIPVLPYFYAVERAEDIPSVVDAATIARLRDNYRRTHLHMLIPDTLEGQAPKGNWIQLAGASYERSIHGFTLETTLEDDLRLIERLNSQPNVSGFNLFTENCADFATGILNFYFPKALRRSFIADAGIATPKMAAKDLTRYARRSERLRLSTFVIPQVPGIDPSTKIRGVSESLIRTKKYVVPLIVLQPWVAATAAIAYITTGRFNPSRYEQVTCEPALFESCLAGSPAIASGGH